MTSSSIRLSAGAPVGCTMKTSQPRMFSLIRTEISPSEKRPTSASPIPTWRYRQISSASGRLALPAKTRSVSTKLPPIPARRALPSPDAGPRRWIFRPCPPRPGLIPWPRPAYRTPAVATKAACPGSDLFGPDWLGREDSNLRMREPKSRVLPLDDAPACRLRQRWLTSAAGPSPVRLGPDSIRVRARRNAGRHRSRTAGHETSPPHGALRAAPDPPACRRRQRRCYRTRAVRSSSAPYLARISSSIH